MSAIIGGGIASATLTAMSWTPLKDTELFENLIMPWLGFIPIKTKDIQMSRTADVAKSIVIANTASNKEYVSDNVVPHPRTWSINGYLTSLLDLDNLLYVKPTLVLQKHILDHYASDRKTHLFKTPEGEFIDVLISQLSIRQDATYNNAYEVTMELTEFNALVGKMTVLEDAAALANDAMSASLQQWVPILGGALMAVGVTHSTVKSVMVGDNNSIPLTPELSNRQVNELALAQFVDSGDASGFTSPEEANDYIAQYFASRAQGDVSVASMDDITIPDDTDNPIVSQAIRTTSGAYINLLFVWDTVAQSEYDKALVSRDTFRSTYPTWGKDFNEVAANLRLEEPNLEKIDYLKEVSTASSFSDWNTLLSSVQSMAFKFDKFDFTTLELAIINQDLEGTKTEIYNLLFPRLNRYHTKIETMVNNLNDVEANILEAEGNLKWIITFTSDIPGTQPRTVNLETNVLLFPSDDYYSVRVISSKEQIGLQDLGLCDILLEVFV